MTGRLPRGGWLAALVLCSAVGLTACEKPQVSEAAKRKPDTPAYQGADNAYVDAGWKRGDAKSWEEQMRNRAQGQNEYSRTSQP